MSETQIIDIAEKIKRVNHRLKNNGDQDLIQFGLKTHRRIKRARNIVTVKLIEDNFYKNVRRKLSLTMPLIGIGSLPVIGISAMPPVVNSDGYDDGVAEGRLDDDGGEEINETIEGANIGFFDDNQSISNEGAETEGGSTGTSEELGGGTDASIDEGDFTGEGNEGEEPTEISEYPVAGDGTYNSEEDFTGEGNGGEELAGTDDYPAAGGRTDNGEEDFTGGEDEGEEPNGTAEYPTSGGGTYSDVEDFTAEGGEGEEPSSTAEYPATGSRTYNDEEDFTAEGNEGEELADTAEYAATGSGTYNNEEDSTEEGDKGEEPAGIAEYPAAGSGTYSNEEDSTEEGNEGEEQAGTSEYPAADSGTYNNEEDSTEEGNEGEEPAGTAEYPTAGSGTYDNEEDSTEGGDEDVELAGTAEYPSAGSVTYNNDQDFTNEGNEGEELGRDYVGSGIGTETNDREEGYSESENGMEEAKTPSSEPTSTTEESSEKNDDTETGDDNGQSSLGVMPENIDEQKTDLNIIGGLENRDSNSDELQPSPEIKDKHSLPLIKTTLGLISDVENMDKETAKNLLHELELSREASRGIDNKLLEAADRRIEQLNKTIDDISSIRSKMDKYAEDGIHDANVSYMVPILKGIEISADSFVKVASIVEGPAGDGIEKTYEALKNVVKLGQAVETDKPIEGGIASAKILSNLDELKDVIPDGKSLGNLKHLATGAKIAEIGNAVYDDKIGEAVTKGIETTGDIVKDVVNEGYSDTKPGKIIATIASVPNIGRELIEAKNEFVEIGELKESIVQQKEFHQKQIDVQMEKFNKEREALFDLKNRHRFANFEQTQKTIEAINLRFPELRDEISSNLQGDIKTKQEEWRDVLKRSGLESGGSE